MGRMKGHTDWVTSIRTPGIESDPSQNIVVSTSRDKKMMVWKYNAAGSIDSVGHPLRALSGHSQAIADFCLSSNGKFALTGSWDKTLRLWDLETGSTLRTFVGHSSDVLSVALSPDNRQIVSGSRDRSIKLWNTLSECKFTLDEGKHTDWVSCVRFSPCQDETLIVSCGWDKLVKVWELGKCVLKTDLKGHKAPLYNVTISPDGSLCASGGREGIAMLWDVNEGRHLDALLVSGSINALCFSPCNYWLCVATDSAIKIWNLEEKKVIADIQRPATSDDTIGKKSWKPWCTSMAWSADGTTLFAGSSDGSIYVFDVKA